MNPARAGAVVVMPAPSAEGLSGAVADELCKTAVLFARELAPEAVRLAKPGAGLAGEVERAFTEHDGSLLVLWPRLPRLRVEHGMGALDDLAAGCELVLGPVTEGGLYLLGLARRLPAIQALPDDVWQADDAMAIAVAATRDCEITIGLLRAERGLATAADVRAALVDPILPEGIRRVLGDVAA